MVAYDLFIVLLILLVPFIILQLTEKISLMNTMGPVFLCYLTGFLLQFILPHSSIAMSLSEVLIPLAIPLILFNTRFDILKGMAKPMITAMALSVISVIIISITSYFIFRNVVDLASDIAGMLVGLYSGGTPNLIAIGVALEVPQTTIILTNTADLIAGGLYFLLLLSIIPRVYNKFLRPFKKPYSLDTNIQDYSFVPEISRDGDKKRGAFYFVKAEGVHRLILLFLGAVIFAISIGAALLLTGTLNVAVIMLSVTTLGVAGSFVKKIKELKGSYQLGKYLILMFSFAIGFSFDFSLVTRSTLNMLIMLFFVQFGTVILHAILSAIFKIDRDTTIIASTACIFGPAFIIPVADSLKNKDIMLPGLILGILGYALGNYLGIFLSLLLRLL